MSDCAKYAVLRGGRRVWAVAAVHGQVERLDSVHAELGARFEAGDRLVYLGNYLGVGEVRKTIDALLDYRRWLLSSPGMFACDIVYLRGRQEEMWDKVLQLQFAQDAPAVFGWMVEQGVGPTVEAYGGTVAQGLTSARSGPMALTRWTAQLRATMQAAPGHASLMSALRRAALTHDRRLLFVHAGLDTNRSLERQSDALWWGGGEFVGLDFPFEGFRRVVRGFDAEHRGIQVGQFTTSIDGGCGFGGPLLAACFDGTGEILDLIEA